ncbi:MAG: hypothetical protein WA705_15050 [Candidatus Ozemobacteraceae bacterium]
MKIRRSNWLSLALVAFALIIVPELQAQELTLYTMPPPGHLDWSSPRSLMFDAAVANRFTFSHIKHKHTFGHVFIELRGPNGERELTGSTTAPDAPSDADFITKKGYGLGVFWADFHGALDPAEGLDAQLIDRYKSGRVGFITFKINEAMWARLAQYVREYRERGYGKIYAGKDKPREGLGAGCSGFGVSFLEVAGLKRPEFEKSWAVRVLIPDSMIGGPITGKRVSLWKAVIARWAKPGEPNHLLFLYDPDLIFTWINNTWEKAKFQTVQREVAQADHNDYLAYPQFVKRGKAQGLVYDCTNYAPPAEPIWLGAAAKYVK